MCCVCFVNGRRYFRPLSRTVVGHVFAVTLECWHVWQESRLCPECAELTICLWNLLLFKTSLVEVAVPDKPCDVETLSSFTLPSKHDSCSQFCFDGEHEQEKVPPRITSLYPLIGRSTADAPSKPCHEPCQPLRASLKPQSRSRDHHHPALNCNYSCFFHIHQQTLFVTYSRAGLML
jgi:hypothetical protein